MIKTKEEVPEQKPDDIVTVKVICTAGDYETIAKKVGDKAYVPVTEFKGGFFIGEIFHPYGETFQVIRRKAEIWAEQRLVKIING